MSLDSDLSMGAISAPDLEDGKKKQANQSFPTPVSQALNLSIDLKAADVY